MRLAFENAQDVQIDYRGDRVVESAEGPRPAFAAHVTVWWPEKRGAPVSYSYEDLLSTPHLEVTNERLIAYRLLDVDGMVVYGQVEGLLGRPTSGILGVFFRETEVEDFHLAVGRELDVRGLRSRWMMPCSCASSSPSAICVAMAMASSMGIAPRESRCEMSSPSTSPWRGNERWMRLPGSRSRSRKRARCSSD